MAMAADAAARRGVVEEERDVDAEAPPGEEPRRADACVGRRNSTGRSLEPGARARRAGPFAPKCRAMAEPDDAEIVLSGGNMTPVVRVGDSVRRAAGRWTPTVHALLRHLRERGFDHAPEPRGIDAQGREVLSFVPGRVGTYPLAAFMLADASLVAAATLLRAFHDATADFPIPPDAVWQWRAHDPTEVICHNDFAPYNLVWNGERLVGVIDLDLASPGPRVWDAAYAAYRFVPLTDPANPDVPYPGTEEQARRLELFCAAYGDALLPPAAVVDAAAAKLRELVAFIVAEAGAGDPAQQAVLARGDTRIYERDLAHLERHRGRLV
jgi:phosphotransferase family enzyme